MQRSELRIDLVVHRVSMLRFLGIQRRIFVSTRHFFPNEKSCETSLHDIAMFLASVIGLAPIRLGLKDRLLELLCIHGQNRSPLRRRTRSRCSLADVNSANSVPPWRCPSWACDDASAAKLSRLVSEERSKVRDDGHEPGIHEVPDHGLNVFVSGGRFLEE
jgi:hypothetical protein